MTKSTRSRSFKPFALGVAVAVGGLAVTGVLAQGAPATVQSILNMLATIQASIAGVQDSVDGVQDSVDALGATGNVAFTSSVNVQSGILYCIATNVADESRQVNFAIRNTITGEQIAAAIITLAPGTGSGTGLIAPSAFSGFAFCRFEVADGTKADIRGSLLLSPVFPDDETTTVSVPAE